MRKKSPKAAPSRSTAKLNASSANVAASSVSTELSGPERFRRTVGLVIMQVLFGASVFILTKAYYEQPLATSASLSNERQRLARGSATANAAAAAPRIPATMFTSNDPTELQRVAGQQFQNQDFSGAAATYERLLALDANDPDMLNNYALVLHYLKRSDEAQQHLQQALSLSPRHQRSWLTIGFVHKGGNRIAQAKQAFEQVLAIDANNSMATEARRLLATLK